MSALAHEGQADDIPRFQEIQDSAWNGGLVAQHPLCRETLLKAASLEGIQLSLSCGFTCPVVLVPSLPQIHNVVLFEDQIVLQWPNTEPSNPWYDFCAYEICKSIQKFNSM
jgi:hypothetical protein